MNRKTDNSALSTVLGRRRWRRGDAEVVVSAWRDSGQSVSAFARRHGLSVDRVLRWRQQLDSESKVEFHRVALVQEATSARPSADSVVELVLENGRRVAVRRGFDASLLEGVVRAVESWSC